MSDLHALMRDAAPRLTATAETDVDADVARGRRSLRVRRGRRTASISGIGAAALIGALAVADVTNGPGSTVAPQAGAGVVTSGATALVAFVGEQPAGFRLETVPVGWEVQSSTLSDVVLAPPGARNQDGGDWVGKLGVQLSLDSTPDLTGSTVRVNGRPAVVMSSDGASTLYVRQTEGYLVVQAWQNLGWDEQRLVEFAEGITVTQAAQGTAG